jgi:hypothetical protein
MSSRIIKLGDQDWRVTPFHCVVGQVVPRRGPLDRDFSHLHAMYGAWTSQLDPAWAGMMAPPHYADFVCPHEWRDEVASWRRPDEHRSAGCWVLNYTNNPLVVNEYKLEEITLACVDEGRLVVTNFADLPGAADASKVYFPGEFWLNYAEGGAEKTLREGIPRK